MITCNLATNPNQMAHTLPDLPYAYDALEPHLDVRTMEIHHKLHHGGYVKKLNAALEGTGLEEHDLMALLRNPSQIPEEKRSAVVNNGSGHYNHARFWEYMSPNGGGEPEGALAEKIAADFGSYTEFKDQFTQVAATTFGSGWAWLYLEDGTLKIGSYSDHGSPMMEGKQGILCLDVWEHAYYLNYQNRRPDYIAAWWNVVNWEQVAKELASAEA